MIISNKIEKYDDVWRLVTYDTDDNGKCTARYTATEMQEEINTFYVQQAERLKNLQEQLLEGTISPIGFYVEYCRMDVRDVAARLRMAKGTVKKHLTPEGFDNIKIETLKKYARIFDVSVGDFFNFVFVPSTVSVDLKHYRERLVQYVRISDEK